jgi:Holliday junction resolvase
MSCLPPALRSRTNYRRGADFERTVAKRLIADGYWVVRAAGSHGKADLVAIKLASLNPLRCHVVLVQCKLTGPGGVPPAEWNEIWEVANRIGAIPVVAHKPARGRIEYLRLVGPKLKRSRVAPARPWSPDQLGGAADHE